MRQVFIMSGIPGCGKSTLWRLMCAIMADKCGDIYGSASADYYFDRIGRFDPSLLGEAHKECFRHFMSFILEDCQVICVDNTNLSAAEIAPYYLAGEAFGYNVTILRVEVNPAEAYARQLHNVPANVHAGMVERFNKRDVMPWWNVVPIGNDNMSAFLESFSKELDGVSR